MIGTPPVYLVTPQYVAASTGADVTDVERTQFLIGEASSLVMDYVGRTYTPETAPTAVKQAVSIMVASALEAGGTDGGDVKAEQIGDYRVEFGGAGQYTDGLDIRQVEYLLAMVAGGSRAIRTDVPLDGLPAPEVFLINPLAGALVVNG